MGPPPFRCTGDSILTPKCNKTRKEIFVAPVYDEQLQFIHTNGLILQDMKYLLELEDGTSVNGITDKQGRTKRIRTAKPVAIRKAKLSHVAPKIPSRAAAKAASEMRHSCSLHPPSNLPEFLVMEINGIKTNSLGIGTSVAPVKTPLDQTRPLTAGEIRISKILFKDSIDYSKVKVHNGDFFWFGWQDKDTAVTPNGEIYFPKDHFMEDFSKGDESERHWFIHEMVHVWQHQIHFPVALRGAMHFGLDYKYTMEEGNVLWQYNMEAQGDLLADYWALLEADVRGTRVTYMKMGNYANDIKLYEKVLRHFIADRRSWKNWSAY